MERSTNIILPVQPYNQYVAETNTLLGLDLSTHTGWAVFKDGQLSVHGIIEVSVPNLGWKCKPEKCAGYPANILRGAEDVAANVAVLLEQYKPSMVVIENTVLSSRGSRSAQRLLEWIHLKVMEEIYSRQIRHTYMDPSEWRAALNMRLSKEQKKNNSDVSKGKRRGRITKKHLSVSWVNARYGLNLKLCENDRADAISLCSAQLVMSGIQTCSVKDRSNGTL